MLSKQWWRVLVADQITEFWDAWTIDWNPGLLKRCEEAGIGGSISVLAELGEELGRENVTSFDSWDFDAWDEVVQMCY